MKSEPALQLIFPQPQQLKLIGNTVDVSRLDAVAESIDPAVATHAQGYRLTINEQSVQLVGHDEAGLFYGRQSLAQLRMPTPGGAGQTVLCLEVNDWPDLETRGYMLDVSRDRVPKIATIKRLIDKLALLKFNQLQIYTEHTIAYTGHEAAWRDASPLSFAEIAELENYCKQRYIDMVPCQNVFGHMERWLTKPEYEHLAETLDGWDTPWGYHNDQPNSLDPSDPKSFELSADLIDQLVTHSDSNLLNICCDETNDIGQGKSKARVEKEGRAAVYLDYLQRLCAEVSRHGKTPMFWGDIILHHPELIPQIPKDAVLLNWWYEAENEFDDQCRQFAAAGVRFYVCPGTSSWCTLTGRGRNTVDNCRAAAEAAIKHGAEGLLITDWGDHGHWQPFAISWPGLIYGAGVGWAMERNCDYEALPYWISRLGLDEPTDELGQILWDLSNVYLKSEAKLSNATWWFHALQWRTKAWTSEPRSQVSTEDVQAVSAKLAEIAKALAGYAPRDAVSALLKRDIQWCIDVTQWVCAQSPHISASGGDEDTSGTTELEAFASEFRELWLTRYRPGGLEDSVWKLTGVLRPGSWWAGKETHSC